MFGFLGRTALLVCGGALLILFVASRQTPAPVPTVLLGAEPEAAADYMPLRPGRIMTYASADGDRFTLTFLEPVTLQWFDGTWRELHPVHDQRCGCQVLLEAVDGEVRAVGSIEGGHLHRWGEYIVVLPRDLPGPREAVETPAGSFDRAVPYRTAEGTAWFAPGVGMVKTEGYRLIKMTERISGRLDARLTPRGEWRNNAQDLRGAVQADGGWFSRSIRGGTVGRAVSLLGGGV